MSSRTSQYLLTAIIAVAATLAVQMIQRNPLSPPAVTSLGSQTAYDQVVKNNTLRCSYVVSSPHTIKDPNTGKLSGIMYDITEEAAKRLGLKVDWVEEVTWATYFTGLQFGRYDAFCGAGFSLEQEIKNAELVGPAFYAGITAWVRPDDHRFDADVHMINAPDVKISAIDGSIGSVLAREEFPNASVLSAPSTSDYTFNPLNVANHKADVTFLENQIAYEYLEKNPGTLRGIGLDRPLHAYPVVLLVNKGEFKLQSLLDGVVKQMAVDGAVDGILKKYEKAPKAYYRVAKPYQ